MYDYNWCGYIYIRIHHSEVIIFNNDLEILNDIFTLPE